MAETRLKVTYSVTSTTYSTQLFKTSYFSKAELEDGTELPSNIFDVGNHAYVFSATGKNIVYYTLTGNTIGNEAFEGMTRITNVIIPSQVTAIGERCFRNCTNLLEVYSWPSLTSIGAGAFDSTALNYIYLRSTALTMGDRVFYGCSGLTDIFISAQTAPSVYQYTFHNVPTGGTLHYSAGSDYSSWLSEDQYYLGYYDWNTDEMGVTTPGSVFFTESGKNLSSGRTYPGDDMWIRSSGCTISSSPYPTLSVISDRGEDNTNWLVVGAPSSNPWGFSSRFYASENTGAERGAYVIASGVTDTNGNVYNGGFDGGVPNDLVYHIVQAAGTSSPDRWMVLSELEAKISETQGRYNFYVEASGCSIDSSHTPTISFKSSDNQSTIAWLNQARVTFDANNSRWEIEYHADENTGAEREAIIVVDGVYDTDGNVYNSNSQAGDASSLIYYVLQYEGTSPTPSGETIEPGVWPWLGQSAITVNYVGDVRPTVVIGASGCSLVTGSVENSGIVPTYMEVPDLDIVRDIHSLYVDNSLDGEEIRAYRIRWTKNWNTGSTNKVSVVTFFVQDTSGNTYPVDFQITQTTGATVLFEPTQYNVSSNAGTAEFTARTINCNFTGAGLTLSAETYNGDWSTGPVYYEIVKVNDNQMVIRVNYPQNTGEERYWMPSFNTLTDAGNSYGTIRLTQSAYTPSPGEVSATSITLNVASSITGTGQATTTVNPSDATTNLRYTSSNSTIATIDQNGRITVVRNGQVTICVKDLITGLQDCKTIRVTKGSTPGGDDDDLIYVYTGITVNDNEGHRYNITAEPGYKYGCLGKTYKTVSACEARYSLYYINAYGGVDVLPCKGKSSMKKDNITRYNYSRTFRNNTLEFENTNYLSEIKTTWQLHTGYMVDTQSEKMHHLVESTCVFLYDALEQTYTPVVMTDKTLEYKTFHNQGRTFYDYTINIEESQSKERR